MKRNPLLTTFSLLSIVLMTVHVSDDIVRGISRAGPENVFGVLIFVVWLCGTVVLAEHGVGYAIMLLGGLFAAAMPLLHMSGARYASIVASTGGLFFVWTLFAVGVTGTMAFLLAARALWNLRTAAPER